MINIITKWKLVVFILVFFLPLPNVSAEEPYRVLQNIEVLPLNVDYDKLVYYEDKWQPDTLPVYWRNRYSETTSVWYRIRLPRPENSQQIWWLYVWRLNNTADVWLNGNKIGSSTSVDNSIAHHWNRPFYFTIHPIHWKNNNELLIRHRGYPDWAVMEPIVLGPESYLKPLYEQRYFLQHDVMFGLFILMFCTGIFVFVLWLNRRQETAYFWFAVMSVASSIYSLNQFISDLPFSANSWRWLTNVAIDFWAVSLLIFILRSLKLHRPYVEKYALFYGASSLFVYYFSNHYNFFELNIFYHFGSIFLGIYAIGLTLRHYLRTHHQLSLLFVISISLLVGTGIHDIVMQTVLNRGLWMTSRAFYQFNHNLLQYAVPLTVIILAGSLIRRFVYSINEYESLNSDLKKRIEDARKKLESGYQSSKLLIQEKASLDERERIYRDLHDDLGAKLLSLYYRLDKDNEKDLAKSALNDLRDIVSSKTVNGEYLSAAIIQWYEEASVRIADTTIELRWKSEEISPEIHLNELQLTHTRRMLREAISNAIQHAQTVTIIDITIRFISHQLRIAISNNGTEKPLSDWERGRGINNFYIRARELNGSVHIEKDKTDWVTVQWLVDLNEKAGD